MSLKIIDADQMMALLKKHHFRGIKEMIAEAEDVVRCGDCTYTAESTILGCVRCLEHGVTMRSTNYCAHGERKDDEK